MKSRFQFEEWVPFPVEKVFLFFANPQNLPRIMPPEIGTNLVELRLVPPPAHTQVGQSNRLAGVTSEIVTSFRVFPFLPARANWIALVTEFEWNHHFADIQKKGPFKSFHHRHEFAGEIRDGIQGTVVRDVIDCEVGFGPIGTLALKLFIAPQLRKTFQYRQQALPQLLRSSGTE